MKRKFTLLELLIVITIIIILTALLLPTLSRSKKQAVRVVCMSNLKQCFIANLAFAKDNDSNLVKAGSNNQNLDTYKSGLNDMRILAPYLDEDFSIWTCPNVYQEYKLDNPANTKGQLRCNYFYYPANTSSSYYTPLKVEAQSPEDNLMSDQCYYWVTGYRNPHMYGGKYFLPFYNNPSLVMYKEGDPEGVNATFADGHGEWFDFSEIKETSTSLPYTTYYLPILK